MEQRTRTADPRPEGFGEGRRDTRLRGGSEGQADARPGMVALGRHGPWEGERQTSTQKMKGGNHVPHCPGLRTGPGLTSPQISQSLKADPPAPSWAPQ